ncbi:element excision factor XisI family protein [Microcoleus sp. Aus8_D2]
MEEDWTEYGIATDLVAAGVPKEDIVLAFHEVELFDMLGNTVAVVTMA